ncbi:hypothetical protein AWENTII_010803 [Aspergillus wentii]|nr:hypothetical protein MW887_003350 [Aspergillus wentii]
MIPIPPLGDGPYGTNRWPRERNPRSVDATEVTFFFKDNQPREHDSVVSSNSSASHLGWKEKILRQYKKLHHRRDRTMKEELLGDGPM